MNPLKPGHNANGQPNLPLTVIHLTRGDWHIGLQRRWRDAPNKFDVGRTYYDGYWYVFKVWPIWINVFY